MIRKLWLAAAFACTIAFTGSAAADPAPDAPRYGTIEEALAAPAPAAVAPAAAPVVVKVEAAPAANTTIAVPVNEWLANAQALITTVLLGVATAVIAKLPAPVAWIIRTYGIQLLVRQAVQLGINAVPGAVRGAPMTIDVGNRVLAVALRWAVAELPGFLLKLAGGEEGLKARIFAALHLEDDASADALGVQAAS